MNEFNNLDPQRIFKKAYIKGRKLVRRSADRFFSNAVTKDLKFHGDVPIVAVDGMGGDYAPHEIVKGCVRAAKELGIHIQIIGPKDHINRELKEYDVSGLHIDVIHCDDYISMEEKNPATAVRRKKKSSIMVTMNQVAEGKAHAAVAAGSTGAAAAAALFSLKRIAGVERPAIACEMPTPHGDIVLLDAGANADSSPFQIAQHAIMGSIYASQRLQVKEPKIGLLSIGEEPGKGNKLTKETYDLLTNVKDIDFFGNVEGRVLSNREVDVVVCDGFTGNIFLKTTEGAVKMMFSILAEELMSTVQTKVGALVCKPAFRRIKNQRLNPHDYGGAILLGVGGVVIISHGNSNDYAIMNAIKLAADTAQSNLLDDIQRLINED